MKIIILSIVCPVLFTACYTPRYTYSPAAQNVPVLVNKGDNKLGAYVSSNLSTKNTNNNRLNESKNRGFDLQAAYAIFNF